MLPNSVLGYRNAYFHLYSEHRTTLHSTTAHIEPSPHTHTHTHTHTLLDMHRMCNARGRFPSVGYNMSVCLSSSWYISTSNASYVVLRNGRKPSPKITYRKVSIRYMHILSMYGNLGATYYITVCVCVCVCVCAYTRTKQKSLRAKYKAVLGTSSH